MEVVCVTVDCSDAGAVARFWGEALGCEVRIAPDGSGAVCRPPSGVGYLEFIRVREAKTVKNRLHLGCAVGELGKLDAEIERLLSLGATLAWEEEFPPALAGIYRNVIMRDVEGNEFCLSGGTIEGH